MQLETFSEPLTKGQFAYERLAQLQSDISNCENKNVSILIDLEDKRTGLPFIFLLACMPYYANSVGKNLEMMVDNKTFTLMRRLRVPGVREGGKETFAGKTGFHSLTSQEEVVILANSILEKFPVATSDELRGEIELNIGEIFNNAHEHSNAKSIFGSWFTKKRGIYCFVCYDTGVGIPEKVNRFIEENGYKRVSDIAALKWAMRRGNSTSSRNNPGLGLDLLREFVSLNKGAMRICTGNVLYYLNKDGEKHIPLSKKFSGTIFEMDIIPDSKTYRFKREVEQ